MLVGIVQARSATKIVEARSATKLRRLRLSTDNRVACYVTELTGTLAESFELPSNGRDARFREQTRLVVPSAYNV